MRSIFLKGSAMIALFTVMAMCKPVDLRSPEIQENGLDRSSERQGRKLLQQAVAYQHFEHLAAQQSYQFKATDVWPKQIGLDINPWPGNNGDTLKYQLVFNTFDSRVTWFEGNLRGHSYGLQSWQLYESHKDSSGFAKTTDDNLTFIIPTMHYFMELPYRLAQAPIVAYMGQETIENRTYHKVFATWKKPEPNDQDQYVAYIDQETKRLEQVKYTIRKNFMWTPQNFCGTAIYDNYQRVYDMIIPHRIKVYPFQKTDKKPVHVFTISDFQVGSFPQEELYPFPELPKIGDAKIKP